MKCCPNSEDIRQNRWLLSQIKNNFHYINQNYKSYPYETEHIYDYACQVWNIYLVHKQNILQETLTLPPYI